MTGLGLALVVLETLTLWGVQKNAMVCSVQALKSEMAGAKPSSLGGRCADFLAWQFPYPSNM